MIPLEEARLPEPPPAVVRSVAPRERASRSEDLVDRILACIRAHESDDTPEPYRAVYPDASVSTASGAYQMIDRTWRFLAKSAGVNPVSRRAFQASKADQDRAARWALEHGYGRAWHGTGCPGTE